MATTHSASVLMRWSSTIEAYLLTGLGAMLCGKAWSGQLALYVHPRYTPLIVSAAVVLLLIGAVRIWHVDDGAPARRGRAGLYGLLLAPLLLGLGLPAKPTGSALVDPQQLNNVGSGYFPAQPMRTDDTARWTLLDWTLASYSLAPEDAAGKPVDVVGFVYHAPEKPPGEFEVVRYTLSCCVADRAGVSLPVAWAGAGSLAADQWVRVTGTIQVRAPGTPSEFAIADAHVAPVAQPREPYLYP